MAFAQIRAIRDAMITLIKMKGSTAALEFLADLEQSWRSEVSRILCNKAFRMVCGSKAEERLYFLAATINPRNPLNWHNLGATTGNQECFQMESHLRDSAAEIEWCLFLKV